MEHASAERGTREGKGDKHTIATYQKRQKNNRDIHKERGQNEMKKEKEAGNTKKKTKMETTKHRGSKVTPTRSGDRAAGRGG